MKNQKKLPKKFFAALLTLMLVFAFVATPATSSDGQISTCALVDFPLEVY